MAKINLDYSDGHYSTRALTDEEAAAYEAQGGDVAHVEDRVMEAYYRHVDQDRAWQAMWCAISNEQYMRRREKELMPLEDAEREIRKLKDDLAQAKRMWSFFEDEYTKHGQEKHRAEYVEFTCIYPQPGCRIEALKDVPGMHPEWIEAAQEIVEQPKFAERAAEGMKYQGCCCGNRHLLLDNAAANQLRSAGFLVENDSEEV
jgi:hypothetical protein